MPRRFRISGAARLLTKTTLFRLLSPEMIVTADFGSLRSAAKNSTQAAFARPSTGGAVSATLSASPSSPTIAFLRARGWTLTANVTPELVSCIVTTSYMISTAVKDGPLAQRLEQRTHNPLV